MTLPIYFETVSCAVCGSCDSSPLYEVAYKEGKIKKVICNRCSLVYNQVRLTQEELTQNVYSDYLNYKHKIDSVEAYKKREHEPSLALQSALSFIEPHITSHSHVLEVGCSYGNLLKLIREKTGAEIQGLEITPLSIKIAREQNQVPIFDGFLSAFEQTHVEKKYDMVILRHVLEHLHEVHEELQRMRRILKDGGFLFIEAPNIAVPEHASFERLIIEHVYDFSPWSVTLILLRNGFKVVRLEVDKRKRIKVLATPIENSQYEALPFADIKKWCGKRLTFRLRRYQFKKKCIVGLRRLLPAPILKIVRHIVPYSITRIR